MTLFKAPEPKRCLKSNGDLTRKNVLGVGDDFWRHFPVHRSHLFKNSDKVATMIIDKITTIRTFIDNAKKHVRGSKTPDFLMGFPETMNSLLVELKLNPVKYNAHVVKTILRQCEKEYLICELQEGTALGAVKLGKTLPWERDADITFLTANYSGFQKIENDFLQVGFIFSELGSLWCCVDNRTAGGKFMMGYIGWNIELYGQHIMDSELLMQEGIKPSQVLLNVQWVNVPRNPGLFVRNRYGREIYQHV